VLAGHRLIPSRPSLTFACSADTKMSPGLTNLLALPNLFFPSRVRFLAMLLWSVW
jgi:hypothetical protein